MNSVPGIKKYYIGLAVLIVVALGFFGYAISQAGTAKVDKKTDDAVQKVADKLDIYTVSKGVPENLAAAGVNDVPDTIQYTKIDSQQYKVCIDYKNAKSGFDAGWWSLLGGSVGASQDQTNQLDTNHSYFDSTVIYKHKKGQNCQTVKTVDYNSSYLDNNSSSSSSSGTSIYGNNSSACSSDFDTYYGLQGQAKIASVDTTGQAINFQASGQTVKDESGGSLPAVSSMKYDSITVFCSSSGQVTSAASLKPGDSVKFFASDKSSTTLDKVQL